MSQHQRERACTLYFNAASCTPLPEASRQRMTTAVRWESAPWESREDPHLRDNIRALFAQLLQPLRACGRDVALVPSTSYAMSAAARMLLPHDCCTTGDRKTTLVMSNQMSSNVLCWAARSRLITCQADTSSVLEAIKGNRVDVVAIAQCNWASGASVDLRPIGRLCRERSIPLVLDLTQSCGVVPLPEGISPAVISVSIHKHLYGPHGAALMYVRPDMCTTSDPYEHHERNRVGAGDQWDREGLPAMPIPVHSDARQFDAGGHGSIPVLMGLHASLRYVLDHFNTCAHQLSALSQKVANAAAELGFRFPEERVPHILGLYRSDGFQVYEQLRQAGVHCSFRIGVIRISFGLYNTESEVDELIRILNSVC